MPFASIRGRRTDGAREVGRRERGKNELNVGNAWIPWSDVEVIKRAAVRLWQIFVAFIFNDRMIV